MRILIVRKIGGFGDLMMLSASMGVLANDHEVGIVLDRKWHDLFKYWNIEVMTSQSGRWDEVIDVWSQCPASAMETGELASTRLKPSQGRGLVQHTRLEAFASSLGVELQANAIPKVILSKRELEFADAATSKLKGPIVYVQNESAEGYKSWPYSQYLCDAVEAIGASVITSSRCGDREGLSCDILSAVGIIGKVDLVVSPDSMSVHAAAAMGTPCVLVSGPMNAGSRIASYEYASSISVADECVPCWRNAHIPCAISGGESSVCMTSLTPEDVFEHVAKRLDQVRRGVKVPEVKYDQVRRKLIV